MSQSRMQLYGLKTGSNKDKKTILFEQMQAQKAKYQVKDEYLKAYRLSKSFNHNLQRYIAYGISNKIFVACADTFKVLDVLRSPDHSTPIQCFDVSEVSKDIVSFSEGNGPMQQTIVVFGLQDDSYLNGIDTSVTKQMTTLSKGLNTYVPKQQQLKWRQYWKCDADMLVFPGFLNTLSISPIGDVLLLGGNEYVSLWTRDSRLSSHSFSQMMLYAKDPPKDVYAQEIAQTQVGQVIQSEFSRDGRLFITLECDNNTKKRSLHVWYNQNAAFLTEQRLEKGESFVPNEFLTQLQKLECFDLQARRGVTVRYFKMLPYNLSVFAQQEVVPVCLVTVSQQSQAHLWVEDLQLPPDFFGQSLQVMGDGKYSGISFSCIQVFSHPRYKLPADKIEAFDVQFLQLQSEVNATNFEETTMAAVSPILNPVELDQVQLWKFRQAQKSHKLFDNMVDRKDSRLFNYNTQDFLIVLGDKALEIHKISGLRNTFQSQAGAYSTELRKVHLLEFPSVYLPKKLILANQLFAPLCEANESINILGFTQNNEQIANFSLSKADWELKQLIPLNGSRYTKAKLLEVQTQSMNGLELIAMLSLAGSGAHQIQFYIQHPQFLEMESQMNLKMIGMYESSEHFQSFRFVGPFPQVVALMKDNTIRILSANSLSQLFVGLQQKEDSSVYESLRDCQAEMSVGGIQMFETVYTGQDLLAKSAQGVDLAVQGYTINVSAGQLSQELELVVLTSAGQADFFKFKISGLSQNVVEVTNPMTQGLGEKTLIVELLCLQNELEDDRPYLNKGCVTKCLITAVNEKAQMEVRFLEITREDIKCVWKQVLPDQAARASLPNSTRINQRGTVVPVQNNQSLMGAALGAVYRGMTAVAAPVLQLPVAAQELGYDVDGRMSGTIATILTRHLKKQWYYLYIYDHKHENKYLGYLDLLSFIDFGNLEKAVMLKSGFALDYAVPQTEHDNISILLSAMDSLFVISYNKSRNVWETIRTLRSLSGIAVAYQNNKMLTNSRCPLLIQDNELIPISQFDAQKDSSGKKDAGSGETLALCQFQNQVSHPFYSVHILEDLFYHGKKEFIMKIFIKINEALRRELTHLDHLKQNSEPNSPIRNQEGNSPEEVKISTIVYGTLEGLLREIDAYVLAQVVQRDELAQGGPEAVKESGKQGSKKKDKAIDDFFGGDDESDDDFDLMGNGGLIDFDNLPAAAPQAKQGKKVEEQKPAASSVSSAEREFMAIQDDLLKNLAKSKEFGESPLIDFLLKFSQIHAKDFFSDDMCSILLRQVYLETEIVDKTRYEELTKESKPQEGTQVIKKLAMHEVYAEMYGEKNEDYLAAEYKQGQGNLRALGKWDSRKCALALFTVNQDVVLEELQERFELDKHSSWELVRDLCLPVWVKDPYRLRGIVEHISKVAYKVQGDENQNSTGLGGQPKSQAEAASLWYILMNKRQLLISLFEKEKATGGDKVATMLSKDFSVERWKQAARKNAAVLQAKHRYLMAATLLILGDDVPNALQLMKQKRFLGDPLMAVLTCRMLCLQQPGNQDLTKLLQECWQEFFVDRGETYGDIYLRAIGLWGQEKYVQALNSLQAQELDFDPAVEYIFKQEKGFLQQTSESGQKAPRDSYCPVITEQSGNELGLVIQKLKKAPKVTAALNRDSAATGYGADMAAIWGSPSQEEKDEKKEEEEKLEITIDSPSILAQMLKVCLLKHDMMSAIFLLRENREHIAPRMSVLLKSIRMVCVQVLKDLIFEISQNPAFLSPIESIHTQIESLLSFMLDYEPSEGRTKKDDGKAFNSAIFSEKEQLSIVKGYLRRCVQLDVLAILKSLQGSRGSTKGSSTLLRYELELKLDIRSKDSPNGLLAQSISSMKSILTRLDEQTFKFLEFVTLTTQAPGHKNRTRFSELHNLNEYRQMILELEQHIDCLIIFDHFEDDKADLEWSAQDNLDASNKDAKNEPLGEEYREYLFFTESPTENVAEDSVPKKEDKKKDDPFDGFFGGDDDSDGVDLMDMDFTAPAKKQEPKPAPVQQDEKPPSSLNVDLPIEDPQLAQFNKCYSQTLAIIQRLSSKMRKSLILHLCLITLSFQMSKFYIFRDLISNDDLQKLFTLDSAQLLKLLKECHALKSQAQKGGKMSTLELRLISIQEAVKGIYSRIHFQNLKTFIQKFKCAIEKRLSKLIDLRGDTNENEDDEFDRIVPIGASEKQDANKGVEENLWQDKWETELAQALDVYKNQIYSNENAELQALGAIANNEQVVPQTLEFLKLWLQFIMMNKSREILEKGMTSSFCEFVEISPSISLLDITEKNKAKHEIYQKSHENKVLQQVESCSSLMLDAKFSCKNIKQDFKFVSNFLENDCTVYFKLKLNMIQKHYIVTHLKQGTQELFPTLMKFFFKNQQKMNEYFTFLNVNAQYIKPLHAQYLTLLCQSSTAQQNEIETLKKLTYPADLVAQQASPEKNTDKKEEKQRPIASTAPTQALVRELLGTGVEAFKQRGECISDFAFDNTSNSDNVVMGLVSSGIREIPIVSTLIFRNRIENGLQLIDEENLEWGECLHRYDPIEQNLFGERYDNQKQAAFIAEKDDPIVAAIDSLYSKKSIYQRARPSKYLNPILTDLQVKPPSIWNGIDSDIYMNSKSKLDITHEDFTQAIESHPHLPLYVSGNRRGILSTWRFGQSEDKSLYQFMPEVDPRQADAKKASVKKIMFNAYGDKIMSNNAEGSFAIYQMDAQSKKSRKVPIFALYDSVDTRVTDFDLVNQDNILCTISTKQKTIKIYDTLLPYSFGKQACVMEYKQQKSEACGNMILCNQRKQVVYSFNGRTGLLAELDLRMNLNMVSQHQLSQSNEITAVCLNQANDTLITGYKDGHIKIHSLHQYYTTDENSQKQELKLREKIEAFPFDFRSKKGLVCRIKINQKNGGLFASSQSGTLKLIRTKV